MTRYVDLPCSLRDLLHPPDCQGQVRRNRLLSLLNESVEHHKLFFVKAKEQTRGPLTWQVGSDFPKAILEASNQRHADRPSELDAHQIHTDDSTFLLVEIPQPIEHGFASGRCSEEPDRDFPQLLLRHWVPPSQYVPDSVHCLGTSLALSWNCANR